MKAAHASHFFAAVLAFILAFVLFFSVFFLVAEADHDCRGDNCPICVQLAVCESTLKLGGFAVLGLVLAACTAHSALILPFSVPKTADAASLVSLKVKLSD